jgi:hypothetical protein
LGKHLPHRIILLITFRERFWNGDTTKNSEINDLFRCSKDISMLMVRFFLGELGVILEKGKSDISNIRDNKNKNWCPRFGNDILTKIEVTNDSRYSHILTVLNAANRAVAHIEDSDVNHPIKNDKDHIILIDAIDFTEEKIIEKIYKGEQEYMKAMSSPDYEMKRKPTYIN